jgi:hypothetical protein
MQGSQIVGCGPTGLHHRNNRGLRFQRFHLERLCYRLCLSKGRVRVWARKMGRQEARFARRRSRFHLLTPQLTQKELSGGFKVSGARPEAVLSDLAQH